MEIFEKFLSRLDGCKLDSFYQHFVYFERSAIYDYYVSDLYFNGSGKSARPENKCIIHSLVNSLSRIILKFVY